MTDLQHAKASGAISGLYGYNGLPPVVKFNVIAELMEHPDVRAERYSGRELTEADWHRTAGNVAAKSETMKMYLSSVATDEEDDIDPSEGPALPSNWETMTPEARMIWTRKYQN